MAKRREAHTPTETLVDFGEVPPRVDAILARGAALYRSDPAAADAAFREAIDIDPTDLATYFCLYKIHTWSGGLDAALAVAEAGLAQAARTAGLPATPKTWRREAIDLDGPGRFALYALKALAFIRLRRGEIAAARADLAILVRLDPTDVVGASVVAAIADDLDGMPIA